MLQYRDWTEAYSSFRPKIAGFRSKMSVILADRRLLLAEIVKFQRFFLFQAIQYLQKLCNHPSLVLTKQHPEYDRIISELKKKKSSINDIEHAPKFKALMQLLNDCGIGTNDKVVAEHRALIFCQHKSMLGE